MGLIGVVKILTKRNKSIMAIVINIVKTYFPIPL